MATVRDALASFSSPSARETTEAPPAPTVVAGEPSSADFHPLTVDYRERSSAVGRIPGNYFRRETRAGEHEILTSRLIDRTLRPLFGEGFAAEMELGASGDFVVLAGSHARIRTTTTIPRSTSSLRPSVSQ